MKKKLLFICVFSLTIIYSLRTQAQDITLVKDINNNITANNPNSSPNYLKLMGENLFFSASTTNTGKELWVYNTIRKEVKLVKDLYKGPESGWPSFPTEFKGSLYFSAEYHVEGKPNWNTETALWKTDGTREGTIIIKSFNTSFVRKLFVVGENLFFTASDDINGEELWKSDGTTAGTVLVKDIFPGNRSSSPTRLTKLNEDLYFVASYGNNPDEYGFWRSDGTAAGTFMVKQAIAPSTVFGSPNPYIEYNNELYFAAIDGTNGKELWKSNGTAVGTYMVKDINIGEEDSSPAHFVVFRDYLYFSADNGINGTELWKTNGTNIGTTQVKDIWPGIPPGGPSWLTVFSGNLYFAGQDENNGFELWKSDGTANGTQLFKNIALNNLHSHPFLFTEVAGNLYFSAYDETNGTELWKTDGTYNGTTLVKDIKAGNSFHQPNYLTKGINNLYFIADDGISGYEVWKSDGTEEGTTPISNLKLGNDSSFPSNLTETLGSLFFTAENGINGIELWKSNGTANGTNLVKDIKNGIDSSSPNHLTEMTGSLFFVADDGINGFELWKSNGTTDGTSLLKDINIGNSSSPNYLTEVDASLFFTANDGVNGNELWKSNGTEAGTILLKDIKPGNGSSFADNLTEFLGNLYFTVNDGINGKELWKSDGTTNGTGLLKDIKGGSSSSLPSNLSKAGDNLFFVADDGTNGKELWKSDGTANGTELLKDIYIGNSNSSPNNLTEVEDDLYFTADDGINGTELWKSDGTEAGTILLKDIQSGNNGSFPNNLIQVGGSFYFTANDGINGIELWKSNGTSNGTYLVKDINPGLSNSLPRNLIELDGTLYFTATTPNGLFLFRSDGTQLGTNAIGYLNSVTSLKKFNNEIYIVTFTEEYGEELYKYNPNNNTFYKTGNWSVASNWSKGVVPDNTGEATIKANETAIIDINNVSINEMTIKKYAKVILAEDRNVTITNTLNNFGKIALSSNETTSGVLFLNNPTKGNGSLTYERGGLSENTFSIISSPVKEQKIVEFAKSQINNISFNAAVNPLQYAVATFNDENSEGNKWEYIDANTDVTEKFNAAVGYSISRNTNGSVFFTGTPIVASTNLTVKENKFNAIGNPFTTYFYANKNNNSSFLNDNISKLKIPALYIKDNNQGKYVAYTNLASSETKIIAPGQGFFVKTKPEETLLTFKADKRSLNPNSDNSSFNKILSDNFYLKLNAKNTNVKVTTAIIFDAQASSDYDSNLDIENFNSDSFDIFSKINNVDDNYTIQSLSNENYDSLNIPIGIITNQSTNVTFSIETFNFPENVKVYLEDRVMNKTTNLSEENYTINIDNSNDNRFYLKVTENTLSAQNETLNLVSVYKESKESLKITGLKSKKTSIKIFSILGKEVISHLIHNKTQASVNIKNLSSGLYIVTLTNDLGTKSKKIIIE
jgi:ELWxxDGT repeat protein